MNEFNLYAQYYDLLYSDKDYNAEVAYINELMKMFSSKPIERLLDLGCGTGIHANLFANLGCHVDGVDLSEKMIERAKLTFGSNSDLDFYVSDITKFKNDKTYDVVTSLFHVMSYQNLTVDLIKSFKTASNHLKNDGLFIFDFWYGPGVLTDRPEQRVKSLENELIHVQRTAKPELHINDNIVDVNYEIVISDKDSQSNKIIKETHSMRYFFMKEIDFYLAQVGFEILDFFEWKTFKAPNTNSWNVVVVAKKNVL